MSILRQCVLHSMNRAVRSERERERAKITNLCGIMQSFPVIMFFTTAALQLMTVPVESAARKPFLAPIQARGTSALCKGGSVLLGQRCENASECCYFVSNRVRGCDPIPSSGSDVCCLPEGDTCNPNYDQCCSKKGNISCQTDGYSEPTCQA